MPKNLFQEIVFTVLMVFVMVYAMICYNIALNMGGMSNAVFLKACHQEDNLYRAAHTLPCP